MFFRRQSYRATRVARLHNPGSTLAQPGLHACTTKVAQQKNTDVELGKAGSVTTNAEYAGDLGEVFPDLALCFRRLIPNEARKREGKDRKQPLFRPRAKFFTRNAGRWPLFPYGMGVYCEFFATFAAVTGADGEQSLSPVLHTLASGQEHTYRKSVYGRLFLAIRNHHFPNCLSRTKQK